MPLDKPRPERRHKHKGPTPGYKPRTQEQLRAILKAHDIGRNPVYNHSYQGSMKRGSLNHSRWLEIERQWEKDHPAHKTIDYAMGQITLDGRPDYGHVGGDMVVLNAAIGKELVLRPT